MVPLVLFAGALAASTTKRAKTVLDALELRRFRRSSRKSTAIVDASRTWKDPGATWIRGLPGLLIPETNGRLRSDGCT